MRSLKNAIVKTLRNSQLYGTVLPAITLSVLSRVIGLAGQIIFTRFYGATELTDLFLYTSFFPLYVNAIAGSAFALSFTSEYLRRDTESRRHLVKLSVRLILLVSVSITFPLVLFSHLLLHDIVDKSSGIPDWWLWSTVCFSSIPGAAISGFLYTLLNAEGKHSAAIISSTIISLFLLLALFLSYFLKDYHIVFLGFFMSFVAAGGVAMFFLGRNWLWIWQGLLPGGISMSARDHIKFYVATGQTLAETFGLFLNQTINNQFALAAGTGMLTVYSLGYRLTMVGLPVLVAPLSNIMAVQIARHSGPIESRRRAAFWVLSAICLSIIYTVALSSSSSFIVSAIYRHGHFTENDAIHMTAMLIPFSGWFVVLTANMMFARLLFDRSRGGIYASVCLLAYGLSNIVKFGTFKLGGIQAVIWTCVAFEGSASLFFIYYCFWRQHNRTENPIVQ